MAPRGLEQERELLTPRRAVRSGGISVIRQAISCDICATEKKQTNHWFVAYEQGGELRVSGWHSRNRLRPGSKHLCGQTCLHKLVDEFIAKAIAIRGGAANAPDVPEVKERAAAMDTSLTSDAAYGEIESSARLIMPAAPTLATPALPLPAAKSSTGLVTMPGRVHSEGVVPPDDARFSTRSWRAEAWERERQRELRGAENRPEIAARRRSSA
jgi:hypothetical protein